MAGFGCLASAAKSIERLLTARLREAPVPVADVSAQLVTTEELESPTAPVLTIYCYRIDTNRAMRAAWSGVGARDGLAHLPLDLHFLLTAWATNAEDELRILGRAMLSLETTPVLSGPLLLPSSDWAPNEAIQVTLDDVSTEELMRTFESLPGKFRLSVPYLARVLRLDARHSDLAPRVTTAITGVTPTVPA